MSAYSDSLNDILDEMKSYLSGRTEDAEHKGSLGSGADVLSEYGIDVNATNGEGETLLTIALKNNDSALVIRELLAVGASVMTRDGRDRTTLHYLLNHKEPELETVRLLLDNEADVNARNQCLTTPLHRFLHNKNCKLEVVELLLKYGADVTAADEYGRTPLVLYLMRHEAPDIAVVGLLLDYTAHLNTKDEFLRTPMHCVFLDGDCNREVLELLLKFGVDVKAKDCHNNTPIDNALRGDYVTSAKLIINFTLFHEYDANNDADWMKIIDIEQSVESQWYPEVVAHINQCVSEIDDMKRYRVNDMFSLYDWYRFVNRRLVPKPLYTTEMILEGDILKRYPVYGSTLWTVIRYCLNRAELFNQLKELQPTDICSKLSSDCLKKIAKYLPNNDLLNFISAFRL